MEDKAQCIIVDDNQGLVFNFKSLLLKTQNEFIQPFIGNFSSLEGFKKQVENKKMSTSERNLLVNALLNQYNHTADKIEKEQIEKLADENTFTVTTGHQLSFAGGPLYLIIKAAHCIKLSEELNKNDIKCVPVFWLADEDHDFDEINHINFFGKKISAENNPQNKEICGAMDSGIWSLLLQEIEKEWQSAYGQLLNILLESYKAGKPNRLAFRDFLRLLFKNTGLIFIYGDDKQLKKLAAPLFTKEIEYSFIKQGVEKQVNKMADVFQKEEKSFIQAEAKEVNAFYLTGNKRSKIEKENNHVLINEKKFLVSEFTNEINEHPERISPGVLLRPLFQEKILPNLAYIGGPGEMAYWLQLKLSFDEAGIPFPVLVQRNNFIPVANKKLQRFIELGFLYADVFKSFDVLYLSYKQKNIEQKSLESEKLKINGLFESLSNEVNQTDLTLNATLQASKIKALKAIEKLEEKLNKSLRKKHALQIGYLKDLNSEVFPNGTLNERHHSSLQYLNIYGTAFIELLIKESNPYGYEIKIISLK